MIWATQLRDRWEVSGRVRKSSDVVEGRSSEVMLSVVLARLVRRYCGEKGPRAASALIIDLHPAPLGLYRT